jgi:ferredoxin--NADP+ reductase
MVTRLFYLGAAAASLTKEALAFTPSAPDLIKKAGSGVSIKAPGDLSLFDPNEDGKLQGTNNLLERISNGAAFAIVPPQNIVDAPPAGVSIGDAQHFLEHLDSNGELPLNFAKPQSPVTATVLGRARLISDDAPGDIEHVIMKLPAGFHYVEGQSLSVIPPGTDLVSGRNNKPRLYSIASTRYGDLLDGNTISLCVRRAEYFDPITGQKDPAKKGVCSNFLCDVRPGDQVSVAGPVGKTMLLPKDPAKDVIMIATGTGIAPFRGFMHRLFMENTLARHMFGGSAWLVLGVPVSGGLLYKEEFDCMMRNASPGQLRIDYAISREMTNSIDGGKLYVQHVIAQNGKELFSRLDAGAHVYFCGLKGMMPPILETLEAVAQSQGVVWSDKLSELKKNNQWHVEVY